MNTSILTNEVRLTQYSHGAGCGCKLAPSVLEAMLQNAWTMPNNNRLLVGNHTKDDAAVLDLGNGSALISTTDFFMPIVDSPFDFGRIAAANAISDVYAMGGKPILAIAILGWPINKLAPEVAGEVIAGAQSICVEANISLAGGHSIDCPEPIFGLAVNGIVEINNIKTNGGAKEGDLIYITKALGVGLLSTAEKKGLLKPEDHGKACNSMTRLNCIGELLGKQVGVSALTDVTGFGLLGHLSEMCIASGLSAEIEMNNVPLLTSLDYYLENNCVPGGTNRNLDSYGANIRLQNQRQAKILADPQTSGGLLIAVHPDSKAEIEQLLLAFEPTAFAHPIGKFVSKEEYLIEVLD